MFRKGYPSEAKLVALMSFLAINMSPDYNEFSLNEQQPTDIHTRIKILTSSVTGAFDYNEKFTLLVTMRAHCTQIHF